MLDQIAPFEMSAMTWGELMVGAKNKQEIRGLKNLMKSWDAGIIHFDEGISVRALNLVTDFWLSDSLNINDALIAATAIEHQLMLLTGNAKHFRCVPALELETFVPH